jgi:hypothetical protein
MHRHAHLAVQRTVTLKLASPCVGWPHVKTPQQVDGFLWNLTLAAFDTTAEQYATSISRGDVVGLSRVEAGSNTSTVALRVLGGDEKGNLDSETAKYGRESHGTRTRE